ncbi:DUF4433 domain-containing protein [Mesorhizobium mediterraneum]|uniref:DUF4433 domain-containing protein n=1 Tax=Mesorhizobium mediterraneum TaxID=43617 RepID=UPI00177CE5DF|nr:DUF4433 domain-containing protein [Mesorhizobium mediterraneum]
MPKRFVFRMTYVGDLPLFLADGELRAKNSQPPQDCHQTSHAGIVSRRGGVEMAMPCGGVVNDYVPFYFSPITAMSFSIHRGNVGLRDPQGNLLRQATMDDRVFFVSDVERFRNSGLTYFFSDIACNAVAPQPRYDNDLGRIEDHVDWSLFDDGSTVATIPEIGYEGVTQWFHDRDSPPRHQNRSRKRMAEFLVRDRMPLAFVDCIVTKSNQIRDVVAAAMNGSAWDIPVLVKPGCYH